METQLSSKIVVLALALGLSSACASAPRRVPESAPAEPVAGPVAAQGPAEAFGPPLPEGAKPVVLVLSPGQAHAFAQVGVIRALQAARIPIVGVLGSETGALIGALYAQTGKIQQFEWGILKFKEDAFAQEKSLLGFGRRENGPNLGKNFEKSLSQVFAKNDVSGTRIPLRIAVQRVGSADAQMIAAGNLAQAIRAAVAHPGLFAPADWQNQKTGSAHGAKPYPVTEAQEFSPAVVVVVDCQTDAERAPFLNELAKADVVIRPEFGGLSRQDFAKRNEIIFKGKNAAQKAMPEIRRLTGIPEAKSSDEEES